MRKSTVIAPVVGLAAAILAAHAGAASSTAPSPTPAFAKGSNPAVHASSWWGLGSVYAWTLPRRSCWTGLGAGRAVCQRFSR